MNTYSKFYPNVFVAKCDEIHEKGSTIILTTKYGQEHECVVFNLVGRKDNFYFHSIVRADGFNAQEFAKRKAEKHERVQGNLESKSNQMWEASHEGRDFLALGEPIKVGHHSERKHRALIERNHNRMSKSVNLQREADKREGLAEYWRAKENVINLSMPESLEYFEYKLEEAKMKHEGLKNGSIKREHSFSLTYANKAVKELTEKLNIAIKLWA